MIFAWNENFLSALIDKFPTPKCPIVWWSCSTMLWYESGKRQCNENCMQWEAKLYPTNSQKVARAWTQGLIKTVPYIYTLRVRSHASECLLVNNEPSRAPKLEVNGTFTSDSFILNLSSKKALTFIGSYSILYVWCIYTEQGQKPIGAVEG